MERLSFAIDAARKKEYDLVVCGGGIAGCAAALEGARLGLKTLLVEKTCLLGGLATIGLVNYFVPMDNRRGRQICRGMAEEFLRLSIRYGYDTLPEVWREGEPEKPTSVPYHTGYDPNLFAMLLCSLLDEAGADILFDVTAAHPVMDGGRITGIVTDSAEGFSFYPARQVIDATGDASVAAKAGMPTADGKNYFSYFPREITLDSCRDAVSSGRIDRAIRTVSGGSANLYGGGHPEDVPFFFGAGDGTRSDYFVRNQKIVSERFASGGDRFSRMLVMVPMTAQFRTIRRMEGDTVLHEEDAYRHFPDALCTVNDFDHADFLYEVPRSAMTRRGFDNLTVCGRAVSADGFAWDIVRVIPPAILTGQSAAVCAAQAIAEDVPVAEADIKKIQLKLESEDVMVSFDDSLVPETWDPAVRRRVDKR